MGVGGLGGNVEPIMVQGGGGFLCVPYALCPSQHTSPPLRPLQLWGLEPARAAGAAALRAGARLVGRAEGAAAPRGSR